MGESNRFLGELNRASRIIFRDEADRDELNHSFFTSLMGVSQIVLRDKLNMFSGRVKWGRVKSFSWGS